MRRWPLSLVLALSACAAPLTPNTPPQQIAGQPPAIREFPSQGAIPTPMPGAVGGTRGEAMSAAPGMPMADSAGGAIAPTAPSAPRPAPIDIMPPIDPSPQIPPEPGLLTAGEWDDLAHWDFWLGLLQDSEWRHMPTTWGLNTQQRFAVQVTGPNGPMADVPVTLQRGESVVFEGRTNHQGQVHLFAGLLASSSLEGPFTAVANLGSETLQAEVKAGSVTSLTAETALAPALNADLMLVVDTTGSMGDELEYLKRELENVSGRIAERNSADLKLRLSTNFYRDLTDEYVVRPFSFTEDASEVRQQLNAQSAGGGGDFPEAVDVALQDAVDEHRWSPTARARLLFLVLDAPPHQGEDNLRRLRTSLTRAAAKGIRIIPIASSGVDKDTEFLLRMMAIATGGRYVFLTDDSGIGGSHLKPTIGEHKVEKLNDLMVRIANEYIGETQNSTQQ
jgi:hypothetical protein